MSIRRVLDRYADNPRAQPVLGSLDQQLDAKKAELRTDVQTLLAQSGFIGSLHSRSNTTRNSNSKIVRHALGYGVYREIELIDASNNWKGTADLIFLSTENCEIRDYKTGSPKETDHFQLEVYAWLWSQDRERNPDMRFVDKLVLIYPFGIQEVPAPDKTTLEEIREQLCERASKVLKEVSAEPPPTRPDEQVCRYCQVRQMCQTYWETLSDFSQESDRHHFTDLQLTIDKRRGPKTWDAQIDCSRPGIQQDKVIVKDSNGLFDIPETRTVRLLSAVYSKPEPDDVDADTAVVTVNKHTEMFLVP